MQEIEGQVEILNQMLMVIWRLCQQITGFRVTAYRPSAGQETPHHAMKVSWRNVDVVEKRNSPVMNLHSVARDYLGLSCLPNKPQWNITYSVRAQQAAQLWFTPCLKVSVAMQGTRQASSGNNLAIIIHNIWVQTHPIMCLRFHDQQTGSGFLRPLLQ